jgi:hypothetical protein
MWRVKRWDEIYENANTRKIKNLTSVLIPNKHDGKGFRRVARREDATEIYSAWILILQVASKSPRRGLLVDEDGELEAEDLADKTGFPAKIFETALKVLSAKNIGWMEAVLPGDCPSAPGDGPGSLGLTERNGTERNGREENINRPAGGPVGFAEDWDSENWLKARELANTAARKLWPKRQTRLKPQDRELIARAAYLAVTRLSESWFQEALDETVRVDARKPAAFFKTLLWKEPRLAGADLNAMLDAVALPADFRSGDVKQAPA